MMLIKNLGRHTSVVVRRTPKPPHQCTTSARAAAGHHPAPTHADRSRRQTRQPPPPWGPRQPRPPPPSPTDARPRRATSRSHRDGAGSRDPSHRRCPGRRRGTDRARPEHRAGATAGASEDTATGAPAAGSAAPPPPLCPGLIRSHPPAALTTRARATSRQGRKSLVAAFLGVRTGSRRPPLWRQQGRGGKEEGWGRRARVPPSRLWGQRGGRQLCLYRM
jgi:hypothetical protein